jgi:hypothetical protein
MGKKRQKGSENLERTIEAEDIARENAAAKGKNKAK